MVAQAVATIALGLLGASGVAKLMDPDPTTGAMRAAHIPSSNSLTYALGSAELGIAIVSLTMGGIATFAGAVLYLGFAVFTFAALGNRIPVQSCGCFGREDTPPNVVHVVFNLTSAVALLVVGVGASVPIDWSLPVVEIVLHVSFAAMGVAASYLLLTRLPQLQSTYRSR